MIHTDGTPTICSPANIIDRKAAAKRAKRGPVEPPAYADEEDLVVRSMTEHLRTRAWCLRTDGASGPLPCSLSYGHAGPCYFRGYFRG